MGSKAVKFKDKTGNNVYPCPYYPVGSIYMSVNNINPANFFGGKWEQIKDSFLLACGDTYQNGTTGGEANHILTIAETPTHSHNMYTANDAGDGTITGGGGIVQDRGAPYKTYWATFAMENAGGGQPHNNMPPYLAVYVWKRTA